MTKSEGKHPTIQVLERAFGLLDVLASYQDPVSLKVISEQTGLHPSTAGHQTVARESAAMISEHFGIELPMEGEK